MLFLPGALLMAAVAEDRHDQEDCAAGKGKAEHGQRKEEKRGQLLAGALFLFADGFTLERCFDNHLAAIDRGQRARNQKDRLGFACNLNRAERKLRAGIFERHLPL